MCAAPLAGSVDGNVLVAHKVLAGGNALGDLDVVGASGCSKEFVSVGSVTAKGKGRVDDLPNQVSWLPNLGCSA